MLEDRIECAFLVFRDRHGRAVGGMDGHNQFPVMHDGFDIGEVGHAQRQELRPRDAPQIRGEFVVRTITVFEGIVQVRFLLKPRRFIPPGPGVQSVENVAGRGAGGPIRRRYRGPAASYAASSRQGAPLHDGPSALVRGCAVPAKWQSA